MKPRALDLFCGAGGASMGLHRAGFDVVGVDIKRQPRYPFMFVQADALAPPFDLGSFVFIWASPPCQAHSALRNMPRVRGKHPNLIPQTREVLLRSDVALWAIENVPGAPIRVDLALTGGEFNLDIIRRRHFELHGFTAFTLHRQQMRIAGDGGLATVAGHGTHHGRYRGVRTWLELPEEIRRAKSKRNSVDGWRAAMGIDWMTRDELAQSIPPAYSEFIGRAALEHLTRAAA